MKQSLHGYKEELETNIVSKAEGDKEKVNLLNENVKNYIPSLEENDVGKFGVVGGELYYLGNDELSKKAAKNQKMEVMDNGVETESNVASRIEEKAIDSMVKSRGKDAFEYTDENGEQKLVGIELVKKNFENSTNWKIVTETGEDGKIKNTYDEGYYYIPNGTNISGIGKTTCGYIVDYDSDDVIRYKEGTHKYFSYEESVAVTDHLLFSADPGIIDSYFSNPSGFKKEDLGKGIEFYGYGDGDEPAFEQAFTPTSFMFDGKDDYITVDCDTDEGRESIGKRGLTFEFYGVLYDDGDVVVKNGGGKPNNTSFSGLFSYWDGKSSSQGVFRFGFYRGNRCISWSFMTGVSAGDNKSLFGPECFDGVNYWNQRSKYNVIEFKQPTYLTIVIDPTKVEEKSGETLGGIDFKNNPCIKQNIFIGDQKVVDGWYSKAAWDLMIENKLNSLNKFCLGTCSMSNASWWWCTHMECYSLRFYNKALTDDEVKANREKTIEYHKILEDQSKKSVN